MQNITTFDTNKFLPYSVGFDSLFDKLFEMDMDNSQSYPPYNIRKVDSLNYVVEMDIAGFGKADINIEYADNTMTVKSIKKEKTDDKDILHKGISQRSFIRSFALADDMVVKDAKLDNGLLSINIEKIVPDEKKPKTVSIK